MKTFKQHLDEKTEYYLDPSKDNTEKYVANDGDYWYVGRVGTVSYTHLTLPTKRIV